MSTLPHQPSDLRLDREAKLAKARLYLCIDSRAERGDLAEFLHAAYEGGVDIIQLRDKKIEARAEIEALELLGEVAKAHGKLFAANDRADIALLTAADVFHVGQKDLSTQQIRRILGPDVLVGRSNNSLTQFAQSYRDPGLDYAVIGPVWETPTKPGRPAVGLATVREVAGFAANEKAVKPWWAIGGVNSQTAPSVLAAGAQRIVVVRAIADAPSPEAAALQLKELLA